MKNKIIAVALLTSLIGILDELETLWLELGLYYIPNTISNIAPSLNLSFINNLWWIELATNIRINLLDIFFYCTLVVGIIQAIIQKHAKYQLIRLSFLILFISNFTSILHRVFPFDSRHIRLYETHDYFTSIFWLLIAFSVLKYLKNKNLNNEIETSNLSKYLTSKPTRLFHFLFDTFIFFAVISIHSYSAAIFSIIFTPVYYLVIYILCEAIFKVSPSKIITGTTAKNYL